MTNAAARYHVPTRPYTLIDAINRVAAATGSVRGAVAAAGANYNGHAVSVTWNSYRRYYVADYYWGERVTLARGKLAECVAAALAYYERGALGASVSIGAEPADAEDPCLKDPRLVAGTEQEAGTPAWRTWHYEEVTQAMRLNLTEALLRVSSRGEWDAIVGGFNWVNLAPSSKHSWRYACELPGGGRYFLLWDAMDATVVAPVAKIQEMGVRSEKVPGTGSAMIRGTEGRSLQNALTRVVSLRPLDGA